MTIMSLKQSLSYWFSWKKRDEWRLWAREAAEWVASKKYLSELLDAVLDLPEEGPGTIRQTDEVAGRRGPRGIHERFEAFPWNI